MTYLNKLYLVTISLALILSISCSRKGECKLDIDNTSFKGKYEFIIVKMDTFSHSSKISEPQRWWYYNSETNHYDFLICRWNGVSLIKSPLTTREQYSPSAEEKMELEKKISNYVSKAKPLVDVGSKDGSNREDKGKRYALKLLIRWPSGKYMINPITNRKDIIYRDLCVIVRYGGQDRKAIENDILFRLMAKHRYQIGIGTRSDIVANKDVKYREAWLGEDLELLRIFHDIAKTPLPVNTLDALPKCKKRMGCGDYNIVSEFMRTPIIFPSQIFATDTILYEKDPVYITEKPIDREAIKKSFIHKELNYPKMEEQNHE